jgi:aryl-alcohol dehydrogenase-like predicted oxidoreductase
MPGTAHETRKVGSLEVSIAGLGCNNFGMRIDEAGAKQVTDAALDAGINNFDTAESYGNGNSEVFLGRALGSRRADAVITTKFGGMRGAPEGMAGGSAANVRRAIDGSLERLGTDYVDLYLLHVPDASTPVAETLGALNELIDAGKVREIGCSNFSAAMLDEAADVAAANGLRPFVNVQNNYSLLDRNVEQDALPAIERLGMTLMPYFPLASGVLTGKYTRGEPPPEGTRLAAWGDRAGNMLTDERMDVVDRLAGFARDHGHTLPELALSWLASCPAVASVIAGATTPEQVRANAAATAAWKLTDAERAEIDALARVG